MPAPLTLRDLTPDERDALRTLAHGQKLEARVRDRARICWLSHEGRTGSEISTIVGCGHRKVRRWLHRFNAGGLTALTDAGRAGRPPTYSAEEIGTIVATRLTPPLELGQPFGSWTLDRLVTYLSETHDITMRRSRLAEVLRAEGVRWHTQETWFGERVDPAFADKRGPSSPSTRSRP